MSSKKHIVIKRLKQLGFNTSHLAQYTKLSINDLNEWIQGKKEIPYIYFFQIAEFLSIDEYQLFNVK